MEKAHTIQNYLGLPDIGGEELKAAYEAHLKAMDIEITAMQPAPALLK